MRDEQAPRTFTLQRDGAPPLRFKEELLAETHSSPDRGRGDLELDFPYARALAGKVQRYCRAYVAQGAPLTREDVILDVVDLEPEVDRRRWLDEFGRDRERVPTTDGGVIWLTDAEPWAILEE